ncbi:MAG TPA: group 1 truncated hemoglobin [Mycobacteriales bacterium]|nr:group 1 truncated hemoglobin [Mycobacteriales bacterium]
MTSIFEQIGGPPAVSAAVDDFYHRVTTDPRLEHYFADIDLDRLKAHQRSFLAAALGGPSEYRGRTMADAHADLAITSTEFDTVVMHLVDTLTALEVPADLIGSIGEALGPLKGEIVNAPSDATV